MKYWSLLEKGRKALEEAEIAANDADAAILFEYACGISKAEYLLKKTEEAEPEAEERFLHCIDQRAGGKPVQYITGHAPFFGLDFLVDENVLIPRFDTEILVDTVLRHLPAGEEFSVLDMCTGSGCIAISLAHELEVRGRAGVRITGSDVSNKALEIAKSNADKNKTEVRFVLSDLFEHIDEKYEVIVSNPPYIRTGDIPRLEAEVKDFEPRLALDGTGDGLFFYEKITEGSIEYIKSGGSLFFEIGYDQAQDVKRIMSNAGYGEINVIKDLAGLDRVIFGRYINV